MTARFSRINEIRAVIEVVNELESSNIPLLAKEGNRLTYNLFTP
jgi:hypothetical protein